MSMESFLRQAPVVPVLVIDDVAHARDIGAALVEGGLACLEVTLRTEAALPAIRAMADLPGAVVGAGTVLSADDARRAAGAGARFLVSPGLTSSVVAGAREVDLPLLPGVATAGDIMRGLDEGLRLFKFFPAEAAGGRPALKALSAAFGGVRFCPTGGITEDMARGWLGEASVIAVGGSWLVPRGTPDPAAIRAAARRAAAWRRPPADAGNFAEA